jgi:hypothetical protein
MHAELLTNNMTVHFLGRIFGPAGPIMRHPRCLGSPSRNQWAGDCSLESFPQTQLGVRLVGYLVGRRRVCLKWRKNILLIMNFSFKTGYAPKSGLSDCSPFNSQWQAYLYGTPISCVNHEILHPVFEKMEVTWRLSIYTTVWYCVYGENQVSWVSCPFQWKLEVRRTPSLTRRGSRLPH